MVDAPRHAETLSLARRAIRHLAAAPDQTRRPRRRTEDADQDPPALERSRSEDLCPAPRSPAASHHLRNGAAAPEFHRSPINLQRLPDPHRETRRSGIDPPCPGATATTKTRAIQI